MTRQARPRPVDRPRGRTARYGERAVQALRRRLVLPGLQEHQEYIQRALRNERGRGLIAAALALAIMSLLVLGQTGRLANLMYTLGDLESERRTLHRSIGELEAQLAQRQSVTRLKELAAERGLGPAEPAQTVYLEIAPPAR